MHRLRGKEAASARGVQLAIGRAWQCRTRGGLTRAGAPCPAPHQDDGRQVIEGPPVPSYQNEVLDFRCGSPLTLCPQFQIYCCHAANDVQCPGGDTTLAHSVVRAALFAFLPAHHSERVEACGTPRRPSALHFRLINAAFSARTRTVRTIAFEVEKIRANQGRPRQSDKAAISPITTK
jgi:hypothetical protein